MSFRLFIACSTTLPLLSLFFFFNDTATTEIYTLSLHDALPIFVLTPSSRLWMHDAERADRAASRVDQRHAGVRRHQARSEEHTSELQSLAYLVCRLLLEKKKKKINDNKVLYISVSRDASVSISV